MPGTMLSAMAHRRRKLRFNRLDDIIPDIAPLLTRGHRTIGKWSLGQIYNHLSESIRYSLVGFPGRHAPWPVRITLGKIIGALMLTTGKIKKGVPLPAIYIPDSSLDASEQADVLRAMVERFNQANQFKMHPLIGAMSGRQWERFHCVHCAHHLSFVLPADHTSVSRRSEKSTSAIE